MEVVRVLHSFYLGQALPHVLVVNVPRSGCTYYIIIRTCMWQLRIEIINFCEPSCTLSVCLGVAVHMYVL